MSENIYWVYEGLIIDRDLVNKKIEVEKICANNDKLI